MEIRIMIHSCLKLILQIQMRTYWKHFCFEKFSIFMYLKKIPFFFVFWLLLLSKHSTLIHLKNLKKKKRIKSQNWGGRFITFFKNGSWFFLSWKEIKDSIIIIFLTIHYSRLQKTNSKRKGNKRNLSPSFL